MSKLLPQILTTDTIPIPERYHSDIKQELKSLPITLTFIVLSVYYPNKPLFILFIVYKSGELYFRYQEWLYAVLFPNQDSVTKEEFRSSKFMFYIVLVTTLVAHKTITSPNEGEMNYVETDTPNKTNTVTDATSNSNATQTQSRADRLFDYVYTSYIEIKQLYAEIKALGNN